jgi:hypothetical protein
MKDELKTERLDLCNFLNKRFGYNAKLTTSSVNCDVRIPDKKIRIQTAIILDPEDKDMMLFLGTKLKDEIKWRLIRADYFIIIDPLNYYIMRSKDLKKLIEINNWHWKREYYIESRKDPKAVLIKVPKKFIVYGLTATKDIQIYKKSKIRKPPGVDGGSL